MRLSIILLLALFCYAQLVESGARKRKMKKLAKQIENLQEDIECLMDEMKKCKSELKELDEKFAKMLTCLYKKDPKAVCTFFPGESFPAGDGCNVCTCGRDGGFPMCSLRPVPCNSNDGCPASVPIPLHRPGSIVRQCNNTGDCPDGKICCAKDCHHVCVDPPPQPPSDDLVCPTVKPDTIGICPVACQVGKCGPDERCCSNGCGLFCTKGVKPNRNCPKHRRSCRGPSQRFCTGKCKKGKECCPDGCGGSVCTMVPSTTPSPCDGGALQLRPDGTPVECADGNCPAPVGYCDTSTNICCR